MKAEGRTSLTAPEGKLVCDAYGIAVPKEGVATSAAEASKLATAMGFPVVLKIVSPTILHKTEAGGVLVGVKTKEDVERGYTAIMDNAKKYDPKADLLGVQVQQMLSGGQEVIIGAVTDPSFGKLVAFGLGGILVEVLKDITFRLAPATREDALSMLDGIAAAEVLKGVRGAAAVDRNSLASLIQNVSQLITDFPEISEMDLNPVFATKSGATAADVRIVVDWNPPEPRYRPKHEDIVRDMNRIMKPDAVAVIGASGETGKIGNSVMKNLINGGYQGKIYPINPSADEIMGMKAYKSVKDVPGDIDVAVFAIPAKFVAAALVECGEKKIPGAVLIPSGFAETGNVEGQKEIQQIGRKYGVRLMGPNIYGFYYTWKNLCATLCTAYDVKGHAALSSQSGGIGMAIIGFSRSAKMGVSAIVGLGNKSDIDEDDLLTFFEQDDNTTIIAQHCERSEGRPRVCRSCEALVEEEARGDAEGRPHQPGRARREFAYRRPRRQRQDLRRRVEAVGRDPRAQPARSARIRPRDSGAAHTQGRERDHHHRRRRLRCAAVRCVRRQRPVTDGDATRSRCRVSQIHPAVRRCGQPGRHHRRRAAEDLSGNTIRLGLEDPRIHSLVLGYWPHDHHATDGVRQTRGRGRRGNEGQRHRESRSSCSLAGDVGSREAAEYLFDHGVPAYPYSTEMPVAVLGARRVPMGTRSGRDTEGLAERGAKPVGVGPRSYQPRLIAVSSPRSISTTTAVRSRSPPDRSRTPTSPSIRPQS